MQFVIFQGISQPLNRKGLCETCTAENFLGIMALRTVLTCLSVCSAREHGSKECWLLLSWARPLFSKLDLVPVDTRTSCYIAEALADFCHSLLSRWLGRDAAQMRLKQSCAQTILCLIYARKKKISQESHKETGHGDWFGISRITSEKREQTGACYLSMPV